MHTDSYTRKKTWKVASHGLETLLESKELIPFSIELST